MTISRTQIADFQEVVWAHFATHRRAMPWRQNLDPYWIVVSEIMLQQTQVDRVQPKFAAFVARFPDFASLAKAPLGDVLREWSGLGYNRRAKYLHSLAKEVMERFGSKLPHTLPELTSLPGIGPNTAGAILAYAYNQPVVFVETNVRSAVLHHFFGVQKEVSEKEIREVAAQLLDTSRPREWYWALMDYGSFLKKAHGNNISQAKQYRKQSKFDGSLRQVRGQVIRALAAGPRTEEELAALVIDERLPHVLATLSAEKLIMYRQSRVQLAE